MKRPTWILILILFALIALMTILNRERNLASIDESTPVQPVDFLINETDGLPVRIAISRSDNKQMILVRNANSNWVLEKPTRAEADQGLAEAAATQLTSLRIISYLDVPLSAAGLDPAAFDLSIELSGGSTKQVRIGDLTPTNSGFYASIVGDPAVFILDQAGTLSLLNLLDAPPYLEPPSPTVVPSKVPVVDPIETPAQ
jgi:hypothetical protein